MGLFYFKNTHSWLSNLSFTSTFIDIYKIQTEFIITSTTQQQSKTNLFYKYLYWYL